MKIKPYQYWAIIGTLLFHAILVWSLFFIEIRRQKERVVYELDTVQEKNVKEEKKAAAEKEKIEGMAKRQVQELLSNKPAKRMESEEIPTSSPISNETEELIENFEEQKVKSSKIQPFTDKKGSLTQVKKARKSNNPNLTEEKKEPQTVFYVGKSRVEYFLAQRYRVKLPIPVYKCEGGGVVEVAIVVNRQGIVLSADVIKERSRSASECMQEAARNAALSSVFSERQHAREMQTGRIIYQFVPQ